MTPLPPPQPIQPPSPPQPPNPKPQPQPIQPPPLVQVNQKHGLQHRNNPRSSNQYDVLAEGQNSGSRQSQHNVDERTGPSQSNVDEQTEPKPADTEARRFWMNCRNGFHAVVVRSPPELSENGSLLCSFGYIPLGFSGNFKDISGSSSEWNLISTLFPFSMKGGSSKKGFQREPFVY
ncbi:hypothetical protein KIW84_056571 [Lathyrus oleraceus]|uniref:Uncharacterized protein n=1 Tax=Pisum sativum TaxID=3888 RepID=A0A9D5AMS9_PEA|nr:hypothetical protein KIW84_056571 [Pisum sativum]